MKNVALILASGSGLRCGGDIPKQFVDINGKCVLQHTTEKFQQHPSIDSIYVVTNPEYVEKTKMLLSDYSKLADVVSGGKTRKESSYNGVYAIREEECNVLIHDGVRPMVSAEIISSCIDALGEYFAVCAVTDSTDTVYIVNDSNEISEIPQRKTIKCAQTPQCFRLSLIKEAHRLAKNDEGCVVTDDCGLIKYYKLAPIATVKGGAENIKITYKTDMELASKYL